MGAPAEVLTALDAGFEASVQELVTLARIPSVSAAGFPPKEVERSAEAVAALLEAARLDGVEVLRIAGAHPYVVAEWLGAGEHAPTALIYAHHDVQPPGRLDHWRTPAFEPTQGGDGRLYGRGVVDDKAGVVLYVAALRAWLDATGALPVNVKIVVEGEEEIGSEHLAEFLRLYRSRLDADVLVLSDTANLATGLPSITTSLRGILAIDVRVRGESSNSIPTWWVPTRRSGRCTKEKKTTCKRSSTRKRRERGVSQTAETCARYTAEWAGSFWSRGPPSSDARDGKTVAQGRRV